MTEREALSFLGVTVLNLAMIGGLAVVFPLALGVDGLPGTVVCASAFWQILHDAVEILDDNATP
jgi:hypothetical protein